MQPLVAKRPTQPPRDAVARDSAPRDPAPSRMQYRMHRLWLTPVFRALLRVGLPAFVIVLSVGIWFSDEMRRAHFVEQVAQIKRDLRDRPEFMVKLMAIDGTSPEIAEAIRELLPVNLPVSSFSLDLEELRQAVVEIDAVDRAELRLAPGGILQVDITERVPVAIWRTDGRLEMIDATGHRVATLLSREARPDLPLLAGPGADLAVAEAQSLIAAAQPIMGRVRGLVRIGERRWDVVLDRDQRILLPQDDAIRALERVIALDQAKNVLARDLTHVDMRNENRPTIRLAEEAMEDIRRIRGFTTEVAEQ